MSGLKNQSALSKAVQKRAAEIQSKGGKRTITKTVHKVSRADALKQASQELNPNKQK